MYTQTKLCNPAELGIEAAMVAASDMAANKKTTTHKNTPYWREPGNTISIGAYAM